MKAKSKPTSKTSAVAVILAAGASTRMKSPKSKLLHEAMGRSLIEWAMRSAAAIADDLILVVGHQKEDVIAKANEVVKTLRGKRVHFCTQAKPNGTADAVRSAFPVLKKFESNTPIFIMGGDSVCLRPYSLEKFFNDFNQSNAPLSVMTSFLNPPHAYGRIIRNSAGMIDCIREAKEASREELRNSEFNTGFYLVRWKILQEALTAVTNTSNRSREFYLTDIVEIARSSGWLVQTSEIEPVEALGVNTQLELSEVQALLRKRICDQWMLEGVQIYDPATTWIDDQVEIEAGAVIEQGVVLKGETKIMKGARVGAYSVVSNSTIGEDSILLPFCHLESSLLSRRVSIGPFTRLRPGAELMDEVHLGNFVEVKKSKLQRGVKAGHLSYLGDAEVGEETNIGAGTIFCNYDGFSKYVTKIGKNVFIGSNASLVAPLKIEDGVIVGAGSVVVNPAKKNELVIARGVQKNISDGAQKFRSKRKGLKKKKT